MIGDNQSILKGGLERIQELCSRNRKSSAKKKETAKGIFLGESDDSVVFKNGEFIITFGKYSGKSFSFIDSCDPQYAKWLVSESSPIDKNARKRIVDYHIKQA